MPSTSPPWARELVTPRSPDRPIAGVLSKPWGWLGSQPTSCRGNLKVGRDPDRRINCYVPSEVEGRINCYGHNWAEPATGDLGSPRRWRLVEARISVLALANPWKSRKSIRGAFGFNGNPRIFFVPIRDGIFRLSSMRICIDGSESSFKRGRNSRPRSCRVHVRRCWWRQWYGITPNPLQGSRFAPKPEFPLTVGLVWRVGVGQ